MAILKINSGIIAAFSGGMVVASVVGFVLFNETSIRMSNQSQTSARQMHVPKELGDAIQVQANFGAVTPLNKPIVNDAPEPEIFENAEFSTVSQEHPQPGEVDVDTIPSYSMAK